MHIEIENPVIENVYIVPTGMVAGIEKRTIKNKDAVVTDFFVDINFIMPIREELNKMTLRFNNEQEMNSYLKQAQKNFKRLES